MDIIAALFAGIQIIFGLISLFFFPGLVITLVYFPRLTEIGIVQRLIYSVGLSIGYVIAAVLFLVGVLRADTTSRNIDLTTAVFLAIMLAVWLCEVVSLNTAVRKFYSRRIHGARDRFRKTSRTRIVWHESRKSGRNHIDHTYLLDTGSRMSIQQVIEHAGKISDIEIVQPPHPETQYFELVIREFRDEGSSLVDDLQIYPVMVVKKPDTRFLRFLIKRGSARITKRLHTRQTGSETLWIYSHDFHLFAILNPEDTADQMVDRIIAKLDEIATSVQSGSHVTSHIETTQMLREAFDEVIEKPKPAIHVPVRPAEAVRPPARPSTITMERDRRKLQKEIVRDLDTFHITPQSFRKSDRLIEQIKIPEKADINRKVVDRIEEILDEDWLYE
jgi:hypothetical protein